MKLAVKIRQFFNLPKLDAWARHLLTAYRNIHVFALSALGLLMLFASIFVSPWMQSVLINFGTALVLLPPLLVSERLTLFDDVRKLTEKAFSSVSRMKEDIDDERLSILNLFKMENDYPENEALLLFQESSKRHHISKWGIAVPAIEGRYDVLIGLSFSDQNRGEMAQFLANYVVDAQKVILVRPLTRKRPGFFARLVWDIENKLSTAKMLKHVRDELLDDGLHPAMEMDFGRITESIRRTLVFREIARNPSDKFRTNLGAVICLIGKELALTREGIEHVHLKGSKPIPFWATFEKAGFRVRDQKENKLITAQEYFDRSGFGDHQEIESALTAIFTLYQSGFLSGLYDGRNVLYEDQDI